jgi:pimeloyl-ACP methyl ester carboxylesterase
MSVYCLVHGSTQSPAGWTLLVSELQTRGHECICVDLPTNEPAASASRYAEVVGAALTGIRAARVVAHSASGIFLPLVPHYASVDRLVYLAAVIPQSGQSVISQFRRDPQMFRPDWVGKDPTKDPSLAIHYLFHDCTPDVAQWALSTLRLMNARGAMLEEFLLENWPSVASTYISCTEDRAINPVWWERAARERLHTEAIQIKAGHAPHVSQPVELAAILDSL